MFRLSNTDLDKRVKLDVKDKKILFLLSENSRIPISVLAKKVMLSRDTTSYRIKRMEKSEVILNFYPEINFKKLGYNKYHVLLIVNESDQKNWEGLLTSMKNHPNTISVTHYSDNWDVELILVAKSIEEFEKIVSDIFDKFHETIVEKIKIIEIDTYYSILFPDIFIKNAPLQKQEKKRDKSHNIDEKDIKILSLLCENSRASTYDLSKRIKLSPDAIGIRIKKLYESGIIEKFTILPNLSNLKLNWYTFAMRLKMFNPANEAKFRTFVEDHPHIMKAVKTIGMWDILVYIISENQHDFHKTVKEIKNYFPDIIKNYETWIASEESMFNPLPKAVSESVVRKLK